MDTGHVDTITLSPEAERLAQELAVLTQVTVHEAVLTSLREALARRRATAADIRLMKMREISDRFAELMRQDPHGPSLWEINEDLYDERGLPK